MAGRSLWKGAISIGLVNIPIQVFFAEQKEKILPLANYAEKVINSNKKWCPMDDAHEMGQSSVFPTDYTNLNVPDNTKPKISAQLATEFIIISN